MEEDKDSVVLQFGTHVRLTSVDPYGLCGRDHHPTQKDIGFEGTIFKNYLGNQEDVQKDQENAAPGTKIGEDQYVVYSVISSEGRVLELAAWEIEIRA